LVSNGAVYNPRNQRVFDGTYIYLYTPEGKQAGKYQPAWGQNGSQAFLQGQVNVYFAGKLIQEQGQWVMTDRLGSVRLRQAATWERSNYQPYGAEVTPTNDQKTKFATYFRDSAGLDYAGQRYYSNVMGRFLTPDPAGMRAADPSDPITWNRFAYANGDPLNYYDPEGMFGICPTGTHPGPDGKTCVGGPETGGSSPPSGPGPKAGPGSGLGKAPIRQEPIDQGGGGGSPYSQDCIAALAADRTNTAAVMRALSAQSALQAAVQGTSIDWRMLAAIGVRESGFRNITEYDGAGVGVGIFQVTVSSTSGVTAAQASDLIWAANHAAQELNNDMTYLAANFANFTAAQLLQATAAAYNFGTGNISGNPNTIDVGSAGGNYGSNVVGLMDCFH
jgi:RHS repeat-associated protein